MIPILIQVIILQISVTNRVIYFFIRVVAMS